MMHTLLLMGVAVCLCATAEAMIKTEAVGYKSGDVALEGYLAYNSAQEGKRPGVLVFPEWWGLNDYAKMRARQLAEMGYVAFAADMYGKGVVTTDMAEAGKLAGQFRANWDSGGREMMRERAGAALAVLAKNPMVDTSRMAAIGFCFGGTCALELAYSGANLAAIATFHGGLTVPAPEDLARIKAAILILHGADDPSIKPETIAAMQKALDKGHVDWEMIYYGGAVHGFSNPANSDMSNNMVRYDEKAAKRSWEAMRVFFNEVLRKP